MKYVSNLKTTGTRERGISDHSVELCKIKLMVTWLKGRQELKRTGRIVSKELRKHRCSKKSAKALVSNIVELEKVDYVGQMLE